MSFDRAGRRLVSIEPDAIAIVDLARACTTRLVHHDVRAAAAFDDELWIATGSGALVRIDPGGAEIGEPMPLDFAATPVLVPAACGAPAAVWLAAPPVAIGGGTREAIDGDLAIPLTAGRRAVVRGGRLHLPSGIAAELPLHTSVTAGVFTPDGKMVILLATHAGVRQLLVVSVGTGRITQRCAMPSLRVRIATRRLVAVAQLEPRRLWAVDLRTGRELGAFAVPCDVSDFAIDPDGHTLALRSAAVVELHELTALLQQPPPVEERSPEVAQVVVKRRPLVDDQTAPVEVAQVLVEPAHVEVAQELVEDRQVALRAAPIDVPQELSTIEPPVVEVPAFAALQPRDVPALVDRAGARAQLDHALDTVALWTLVAIADGWDSRRIGYGNEGRHPFELEVAALLGLERGHASDHVAAARRRLVVHEAAAVRAPDAPLALFARELGLSPCAVDVLLVIAAAALRGEVARLYGILANDVDRPRVDELIVQQVLAGRHDRHAISDELDARAPLVRLGVVHVATRRPRPFGELSVEPVVLELLRANTPDLGEATVVRRADRAIGELDLPPAAIGEAVRALAATAAPARIAVRGRTGSGRKTLLAALVATAGRDLAVIDALALPRTADAFAVELRRALRRAQLAGLVPCLVHLDEIVFDERPARDVAAEPLRVHPGPVAVVGLPGAAAPFPPGHVAIELGTLAETERRGVWLRALAERGVTADADVLAARYRVGPGTIRRAVAAAHATVGDSTTLVEAYLRQTRDHRLGEHARRVERLASWSTIVLPADILDSLRELVGRVRHHRTVFDAWGMGRTMQTSRGLTALFQGPPGTGKTLVAGAIARELGLDLYQVDLSKVMSKWIGETERNLSAIFDAAEDGQAILLFDEADSLFARRTEVRSSNDRYANLEVNYLLQRLDAFEGIAILTTNAGTSIDQAFKRRMSFRLSFPFPDEETRQQLWRAHLPPELPVSGALSLDVLARKYQLAGGYIRNACLRAAFLAAQDQTAFTQSHLERAVALEYAELGKLTSGGAID